MPDPAPAPGGDNFFRTLPGIATSILAPALAGAALTGTTSARIPARPGEDPEERRSRILRNAIVGGVLGGSAGGLGSLAYNSLGTAMPLKDRWDKAMEAGGPIDVYKRGGIGAVLGSLLGSGKTSAEELALKGQSLPLLTSQHTQAMTEFQKHTALERAAADAKALRPNSKARRAADRALKDFLDARGGKVPANPGLLSGYIAKNKGALDDMMLHGSTNPSWFRKNIRGPLKYRGSSIVRGGLTGAGLAAAVPWLFRNYVEPALDN